MFSSIISQPYNPLQQQGINPSVLAPFSVSKIALNLHSQPRSGVTILAFSSYPNGFPVLDLDEKTAKKMVEKALPSVSVEQKRLLFGRTKWQGRTVGAVVYPISEQDIRQVQNMMNDSRLSNYERNMKINDYMPTVMSKDTGATRIFDIQRNKLLGIQEAEDLSKVGHVALADANKQGEKITQIEGAASTQAVKEKESTVKTALGKGFHHKQFIDIQKQLQKASQQGMFPPHSKPFSVDDSLPPPQWGYPSTPPQPLPAPALNASVLMPPPVLSQTVPMQPLSHSQPPQPLQQQNKPIPIIPPSLPLPVVNAQAKEAIPPANTLFSTVSQPPSEPLPLDFYAVPFF